MTIQNKTVNKKQVLGIDALRFVAAMMVVWFHYAFLTGAHPGGEAWRVSQGLVVLPSLYAWSNFGWIGVQVFFVISGFVIAFSAEKATPYGFFVSRVARLGPAAWICAPLSLLAVCLVGSMVQPELMRAFRHTMFFLPWGPWMDGSYWTLGVEISFYAMVLLLIKLNRFEWIRGLAITAGVISTSFWITAAAVGFGSTTELGKQILMLRGSRLLDLALVHHGMFFALGTLLWLQLTKRITVANTAWSVLFAIGGCLQIVGEADHTRQVTGYTFSPLLGCSIFLLSLLIVILSVRLNRRVHQAPQWLLRAIRTAGLMTYPVYLLHQVIGCAIMGWLVKAGALPMTALLVTVPMVLAAGWLVAKHIEPPLQTLTKKALLAFQRRWRTAPLAIR
jgi:peptidoglycan/LPS O-acetylase OafA/YrhL